MRALSAIRLSVLTDETTSPERQREANKETAAQFGAAIVGEALDLDVSATKTSPFERPELGKWLAAPDSFDMICWWRQDRAIRNMDHMHALSVWAREHRKVLAFREGPGGDFFQLDFRNPLDPVTQLMVTVFAFAAQMEAQAIKDRVTGAQAALRSMPLRWRGSRPPYGYMPEKMPGGWTLVPDPAAVRVIERMALEITEGKSWVQLAYGLQRDGVPTPRNHWRLKQGREPKAEEIWTHTTLRHVLKAPTLLGYKVHQGRTVRTPEGDPVPMTREPILTRDEWDALQAVIKAKSPDTAPRRDSVDALLHGVAHCDSCGGRMYLTRRKDRADQYKCGCRQRGVECAEPANVRGDWLDQWAAEEFLRLLGGVREYQTRQVPGSDPRPEIEEVTAELERHYEKQGTQRSAAARAAWEKHAEALDARLAALEALPVVEAHTEHVEGVRLLSEVWGQADTAERRMMLRDAGIRVSVKRAASGGYRSLSEDRVTFEVTDEFFAAAAEEALAVEHAERSWA